MPCILTKNSAMVVRTGVIRHIKAIVRQAKYKLKMNIRDIPMVTLTLT